ncbi:hypothetical protein CJU90_3772 [Yarrowia sp. C11]|nr:hypothetical protein CKK34_5382 [Yarrowia sp. E02]KAG5367475.1 hypothetical protein CJU90_3772 [Yarrowia sp. C11]
MNFDWEHSSLSEKEGHVPKEIYRPKKDETVTDRIRSASSLAQELYDIYRQSHVGRRYNEEDHAFRVRLSDDLDRVLPDASLEDASRAECEAFVKQLNQEVGAVILRRRTEYVKLWKEDSAKYAKLQALRDVLDQERDELDENDLKRELERALSLADASLDFQSEFHSNKVGLYKEVVEDTAINVQNRIHDLLDQASEEAQVYSPYTRHLDRRDDLDKREVLTRDVLTRDGLCTTRDIPRDLPWPVAHTILSFSDLESCVQLRQVNTFWYSFFQQSESLLEFKVRKRSPWMSPSGEVKSWADCAVVFVNRLSSKKWTTTDLRALPRPTRYSPVHIVHVRELQWGQKLPVDFHELDFPSFNSGCSDPRELLQVEDCEQYFDLKGFRPVEKEKSKTVDSEKVSQDKDVIVKYKNLEITLPSEDDCVKDIVINKHSVVVQCLKATEDVPYYFLFPIDKLHYKHASSKLVEGRVREIGTLLVHQCDFDRHKLYHYSVDAQKYVSTGKVFKTAPVASYNGLIWWQEDRGIFAEESLPLVPTFVDEKGSFYFREDKIICLKLDNVLFGDDLRRTLFKQCSREPRFLYGHNITGVVLLDLESGIVTDLENPFQDDPGWGNNGTAPYIFPGFVGNLFYVRCWPPDTVYHCVDKMKDWDEGAEIEKLPKAERI